MEVDLSGAEEDTLDALAHNMKTSAPSPNIAAMLASAKCETSEKREKKKDKRNNEKNKPGKSSREHQFKQEETHGGIVRAMATPSKPATMLLEDSDGLIINPKPNSTSDSNTLKDSSPALESSKNNKSKNRNANKYKHKGLKPVQELLKHGKHTTFSD